MSTNTERNNFIRDYVLQLMNKDRELILKKFKGNPLNITDKKTLVSGVCAFLTSYVVTYSENNLQQQLRFLDVIFNKARETILELHTTQNGINVEKVEFE